MCDPEAQWNTSADTKIRVRVCQKWLIPPKLCWCVPSSAILSRASVCLVKARDAWWPQPLFPDHLSSTTKTVFLFVSSSPKGEVSFVTHVYPRVYAREHCYCGHLHQWFSWVGCWSVHSFTLWLAVLTGSLNSRTRDKPGKAPLPDDLTRQGCFSVGNAYLNQAPNTGQMHS